MPDLGLYHRYTAPQRPPQGFAGLIFRALHPDYTLLPCEKNLTNYCIYHFFKPILRNITIAYYFTVYIALSAQKEI